MNPKMFVFSLRTTCAFAVTLFILAVASLHAQTTGTVSGRVLTPATGAYLAGASIVLDGNPGTAKAIEKTFSAKEAASGGASVGGGGCGCN